MSYNAYRGSTSFQIAYETFAAAALDQPTSDQLTYRTAAMEAITGPDSGMVLQQLYEAVMARANVNFGKIPDSRGDLTKFTKYKMLADSISLLERSLGEYNIPEVKITRQLHDNLIRCREDFVYGFKVDSQFLKTTYNTMVYALCEMINLCDMIFIDMLKAQANSIQYQPTSYTGLLLVQNCDKFNQMVKSGEWAQQMNEIHKNARQLLGLFPDTEEGEKSFHSLLKGLGAVSGGYVGAKGSYGAWKKGFSERSERLIIDRENDLLNFTSDDTTKQAAERAKAIKNKVLDEMRKRPDKNRFFTKGGTLTEEGTKFVNEETVGRIKKEAGSFRATANATADWVKETMKKHPVASKVVIAVIVAITMLLVIRALVALFYKGVYKLHDVLADCETFMTHYKDSDISQTGASKDPEKAARMAAKLEGLRNSIEQKIMRSDAEGRKVVKESNQKDLPKTALPSGNADDVQLG